jgi:hypothetical protein
MYDIANLAKESVTLLAPFLPHLLKAGAGFTEEAGKKLGEQLGGGAWETVKSLWAKLRPKVEAKPETHEAAKGVAAEPEDADAQAVLRVQLKKLFAEDKTLADEVLKVFEDARKSGVNVAAIGDRSVALGGNVSGSTIITGDVNKS